MIWQEESYQAALQTQMKQEARAWLKNKIDESKGIIRAEISYD